MTDFSKFKVRMDMSPNGYTRSYIIDDEGKEWGITTAIKKWDIPLSATCVRERIYHGCTAQEALTRPPYRGEHPGVRKKEKKVGRDWMMENLQRYGNTIANCENWTVNDLKKKFGKVSIRLVEDKEFHRNFYVISKVVKN